MKTENPVEKYVKKFAPRQYAKIKDPETFFSSLLEEYQDRELEVIESLRTPPWQMPEEERNDPMLLLGRARAQNAQASEIAWQEIVLDRFPPEVDEAGNPLEELMN